MTEDDGSRSYVVGLPVVVTVHADGTVDLSVDASEASDLWEGVPEDAPYTDDEVTADIATVSAAHYAGTFTVSTY